MPIWIKSLGHSGALAKAYWERAKGTLFSGSLPLPLKEMIVFVVSAKNCARYCSACHAQSVLSLDKKFIRIFGLHLTDQATHDALTQLLNRGTIIQELGNKLALAKRTGLPLGVIMLDLDFFKRINDQYGHPVGDAVLCEAAIRLQAQTRDGDSLGRYGGEEFLVVLYPCTEQEVALAAERFRQAIEEPPVMLAHCSANALALTISLGTTCSAGQDTVRVETLLKQADDALYRSKALGRNRVTRFGERPV